MSGPVTTETTVLRAVEHGGASLPLQGTPQAGGRDPTIDALRGLAIILVVVGHGVQYSIGHGFAQSPVFRAIYSFHMPLFFAISGYLFKYPVSLREALGRIRARVFSLLVPYFSWTLLWYGCRFATKGVIAEDMTWHTIWFLPVLFVSFLLHVAVALASRQRTSVTVAILGALTVVAMYCIPGNNFWIGSARYYYVFFLIGAFVRKGQALAHFHPWKTGIPCVILWLFLVPLWRLNASPEWLVNLIGNMPIQRIVYLAFRIGVALLGVCWSYAAILLLSQTAGRWLSCIGLYSIQIYLVHLGLLGWAYPRFSPYGGWFWVCTFLMLMIPVFVALVAAQNPYVDGLLFGWRSSRLKNRCCSRLFRYASVKALQ